MSIQSTRLPAHNQEDLQGAAPGQKESCLRKLTADRFLLRAMKNRNFRLKPRQTRNYTAGIVDSAGIKLLEQHRAWMEGPFFTVLSWIENIHLNAL
jgi:hypothetical protein